MEIIRTITELEELLGSYLCELRLLKNLDQISLAERAGVSLSALKRLEAGKGARVGSLLDWTDKVKCAQQITDLRFL